MSHLTAPLPSQSGHRPQKPYLFDLPRTAHPLTPPDTDYDTPSQNLPVQNLAGLESEPLPGLHANFPSTSINDSPSPFGTLGTLHRKRPSFTYVNSGIREARERVVQRGLKWLVVVVPPVSFTREHGHLGHTLSTGPSRRLSSGLLMPLYPTLNSQLGAIAREFSFPSLTGLCVYLHTTHSGIALSPRVSDESWPLLWSHLFDVRSPSLPPQQLPISGQIEFDIDLTRARWYDSWLASSRREYADVPQSVAPSRPQSLSHWRADSQTSINEPLDDRTDVISLAQQTTKAGRNIKKLSLLDRFDTSTRSGSKLALRDVSPPDGTTLTSQALSPIVQEDVPATAKKHIDSRVQSWRLSATAAGRSPLAATGQTSLDPANMPNNFEDLPTGTASESELVLDDYRWSVSSVGPLDYDLESTYSWDRVPSVHLDRRAEGSVCLTPSIGTSFGPDDDYVSLSPSSYLSRLPSPDIAWRMLEDVPPTPTTATSWGAPLSFPPSPTISSYAPSIDIAARFLSSRPVTPTTATSWGAPLSFPPSPVVMSVPTTPDIGERVMDSAPGSPRFRGAAEPFEFMFPYYDSASASPWQHVWPYVESREGADASIWSHVWPYVDGRQQEDDHASPWQRVWPYVDRLQQAMRVVPFTHVKTAAREAPLGYPVLDIYPAIYPSFDIYPALMVLDDRKLSTPAVSSGVAYPIFDIYPAVYPFLVVYPEALSIGRLESNELTTTVYPTIEPYPDVYPYLTIYPAVFNHHITHSNVVDVPVFAVSLHAANGSQDIYPTGYPHSLDYIYSAGQENVASISLTPIEIRLRASYPSFDIYPSVYPHNLDMIYPLVVPNEVAFLRSTIVSVDVELQYPIFAIYPEDFMREASREIVGGSYGYTAYPTLDIYPAVYPWNVYETYPAVHSGVGNITSRNDLVVTSTTRYPVFSIYPAVYPYSLDAIYPPAACAVPQLRQSTVHRGHDASVELPAIYPNVCPYPPVYPYLSIYPIMSEWVSRVHIDLHGSGAAAVSQYPYLVIYPSVYPVIEIYPGAWNPTAPTSVSRPTTTRRRPRYSHMQLRAQVFSKHKESPIAHSSTQMAARSPKHSHMELYAQVPAEAKALTTSTVDGAPASNIVHIPSPSPESEVVPSRLPASRPPPLAALPRAPVATGSTPAQVGLHSAKDLDKNENENAPTIVAVEPSPTSSDASAASPVLFEMIVAPSSLSPTPARSRARSGTVSTHLPTMHAPAPSRPVIARPSSPSALPQRSLNGLSGLPPHPAVNVNRRISSAVPRPMSTFGPLPRDPQQPAAPTFTPAVRRQEDMMSPLAEEIDSPIYGRSVQLPSPPEEWERGWRTPTDASPTSPLATLRATADLSRSKTMPSRAAPRGPRSSTMISERAKAFDNPNGHRSGTLIPQRAKAFQDHNVVMDDDGPLKLSMSTLAEFPTPPRPPLPNAPSPSRATPSRLDRSKYPFV